MAKTKTKGEKSEKNQKNQKKSGPDPLKPAVDAFARGDYIEARATLKKKLVDPELSDTQKEVAKGLIEAMGVERGTLLVGLACLGLLLIVIVGTVLTQP